MPFLVIISDDMGGVSVHEDLKKEDVKVLIESPNVTDNDSVEIFEYIREVNTSEFFDVVNNIKSVKESVKEKVALEHYENLCKGTDIKEEKNEFISDYPLSSFVYVTPKRFWESCKEVGIVSTTYFGIPKSKFERSLRQLLDDYRFSDKSKEEALLEIRKLFQTSNV